MQWQGLRFAQGKREGALPGYRPVLVNIFKGLGVVDGEDAEESFPCSHVLVSHGTVFLLPCGIQDV